MKTYCVKCRKNIENLNSKIFRTQNNRLIIQSKCVDCRIKKSRFVKEQKAKGLLSNLGIKTPLKQNSIVKYFVLKCIKMNEIIDKVLLAGDKFMPEIHLRQPRVTYSACSSFTKNKGRIEEFM